MNDAASSWMVWAALGGLVVLLARSWWRGALRRHAMQSRFRRARRGEALAVCCLERAGFRLLDAQVTRRCTLRVDGEPRPYVLRADYVVSREGKTYVADAKTGAEAAHVTSIATRRQLLEYRFSYDVDGVLLVDMERDRVVEVDFGEMKAPRARVSPGERTRYVAAILLGIAVGMLAMAAAMRFPEIVRDGRCGGVGEFSLSGCGP